MTITTDLHALVNFDNKLRCERKYTRVSFETRDFDCIDIKGRAFGGYTSVEIETRIADEASCWTTNWFGSRYRVATGARRGGKSFGGSQTITYCDTEADVDAVIEKYFADAEKRAMSNKARKA